MRASLRFLIIVSFIALIMATFSIIGYFVFANWKASTARVVTDIQDSTNTIISRRVEGFIDATLHINQSNHQLIEKGLIDFSQKSVRDVYFANVIQSTGEDVYSFTYGTAGGEFYGARRNGKNEVEVYENNALTGGRTRYYAITPELTAGGAVQETGPFDPRDRDWYVVAKAAGKPVFSPIYKHFVMDDLAISAAYPVYSRPGALQGVLATHITLSKMNNYLREIMAGNAGTAYIVERDSGYLVANSLGRPNFLADGSGGVGRIAVEAIDNTAVREGYRNYRQTAGTSSVIAAAGDELYVKVTEFNKEGLNWLIITAIPQGPFMAGIIKSIHFSLFISVLAVLLAILIFARGMESLLRPVYDLIGTTERFSGGDFRERAKVARNDEVGKLAVAFNKMADQIHALINTLEDKIKARTNALEETVRQLRDSEDNIRLLLDSTAEAIYGIDLDGNCTFCNASCLKMLRYGRPEELIGKETHRLLHARRGDGTPLGAEECRVLQALKTGEYVHAEDEVFWRSDGTCFPAEYFSYPQYRDGKITGAVVTFFDISKRKKAEAEIVNLSQRDQLTGLYNRRFYEAELRRLDTADNLPLTVVIADMNGLKLVNDSLGHAVGDKLLVKAAEVLTKGCRKDDIVARLGGDEFVILLPKTDAAAAEQIIGRVKDQAAADGVDLVRVSLAFGYGTKYAAAEAIQDVIKKADDQMYRHKLFERPSVIGQTINTIISTLHAKNAGEERHSQRVAELCLLMGEALGLPAEDSDELKSAGLLHDIGKIAVADNILTKREELTAGDWAEIRRHPEIGYRILSTVNQMAEMADYVLAHHERWDGTGYPKGLRGTEIPLQARIISIAEAYDAMTGGRLMPPAAAAAELQANAGSQFDPGLVGVFVAKVLGKRP